jgi:hypothetical protein
MTNLNNNLDATVSSAFICPIRESSEFLCDRPAVHLINGTAICAVHAGRKAVIRFLFGKEFDLKVKQGLENDSQRHYNEFMAGV